MQPSSPSGYGDDSPFVPHGAPTALLTAHDGATTPSVSSPTATTPFAFLPSPTTVEITNTPMPHQTNTTATATTTFRTVIDGGAGGNPTSTSSHGGGGVGGRGGGGAIYRSTSDNNSHRRVVHGVRKLRLTSRDASSYSSDGRYLSGSDLRGGVVGSGAALCLDNYPVVIGGVGPAASSVVTPPPAATAAAVATAGGLGLRPIAIHQYSLPSSPPPPQALAPGNMHYVPTSPLTTEEHRPFHSSSSLLHHRQHQRSTAGSSMSGQQQQAFADAVRPNNHHSNHLPPHQAQAQGGGGGRRLSTGTANTCTTDHYSEANDAAGRASATASTSHRRHNINNHSRRLSAHRSQQGSRGKRSSKDRGGGDDDDAEDMCRRSQGSKSASSNSVLGFFQNVSIPLFVVFAVQCLFVIGAFVGLIAATQVLMDDATTELVRNIVSSDLKYLQICVLSPVQTYESSLRLIRERYISQTAINDIGRNSSVAAGVFSSSSSADASVPSASAISSDGGIIPSSSSSDLCSDDILLPSASVTFLSDAFALASTMAFDYITYMRQSTMHFQQPSSSSSSLSPHLVECTATPGYVQLMQNGSLYTTLPSGSTATSSGGAVVMTGRTPSLASFRGGGGGGGTSSPFIDAFNKTIQPSARRDPSFIRSIFSYTDLSWHAYLTEDILTGRVDLFLAAYAPITLSRTRTSFNATSNQYDTITTVTIPTFAVPAAMKQDPSLTVTSTIAIAIKMNNFAQLMTAVTPKGKGAEGAHTSMYDMVQRKLVCTSVTTLALIDDATKMMWDAGSSPSESLNGAYRLADPANKPFSVMSEVQFVDDHVVSFIRTPTASGLNFAIVQSTPKEKYFGSVYELRNTMIIIGVICALCVVVLCLIVGISVGLPLTKIRANMELAAAMKNDAVVSTRSVLREVDLLCKGFDSMNDKLLQAREFMPQALLCDSSNEEEGGMDLDDDEDEGYEAVGLSHNRGDGGKRAANNNANRFHQSMTTTTQSVSENDTRSDATTNNSRIHRQQNRKRGGDNNPAPSSSMGNDSSTNHTHATKTSGSGPPRYVQANNALQLKRVTILAINALDFHSRLSMSAPSSAHGPSEELTTLVYRAATLSKGVIDSFHGDHFVVSFNAVKMNAQGALKAVRCATDVMSTAQRTTFCMGISTGRAIVGHLGTVGMKRLSIVGRVYSRALALERMCKRFNQQSVAAATKRRADGHRDQMGGSAIECITDSTIARDVVQDSYLLQVLAGLGGQPFEDKAGATAAIGGGVAPTDVMYAVRGSIEQRNNNNNNTHTINIGASFDHQHTAKESSGNKDAADKAAFLMGIVAEMPLGVSNQTISKGGDEWLYEMRGAEGGGYGAGRGDDHPDPLLREVNAVMLAAIEAGEGRGGGQPIGGAFSHSAPRPPLLPASVSALPFTAAAPLGPIADHQEATMARQRLRQQLISIGEAYQSVLMAASAEGGASSSSSSSPSLSAAVAPAAASSSRFAFGVEAYHHAMLVAEGAMPLLMFA